MCRGSESGTALLRQATARWPNRRTGADGMCPSAAHSAASPNSWHEPNANGISRAVDLTHTPGSCDCGVISEAIRVSRDNRVRRCIFNGRQFYNAPVNGYAAWKWQPYFGSNDHSGHMHLDLASLYDSSPWPGISAPIPSIPKDVTDVADIYAYYCKNAAQADLVLKSLRANKMPAIASKSGPQATVQGHNIYTWVPDSAAMRDYALKAGRLCDKVRSGKVADILQAKLESAVRTTNAPAASDAALANELKRVITYMEK